MDALTASYQSQLRRTRETVGNAVHRHWTGLQTYNRDDIPRFLKAITPIVTAGQIRAATLTAAYTARKLGKATTGLDTSTLHGAALRNGVAPATVYTRPFIKVWTDLGDGDDLTDAIGAGGDQAKSSSIMDVALATMGAYVALGGLFGGGDGEIVAWRRVADSSCCDFCQSIDGAHTGPNEPQPLHNNCGCTAEPITRTSDLELGPHLEVGGEYDDTTIDEHGELGPVITKKGDHFTGPDDLHD